MLSSSPTTLSDPSYVVIGRAGGQDCADLELHQVRCGTVVDGGDGPGDLPLLGYVGDLDGDLMVAGLSIGRSVGSSHHHVVGVVVAFVPAAFRPEAS